MKDFFKKYQQLIWKWAAIVLVCLLAFSTCSNCNHKQRSAWVDKGHQEVVDSLNNEIQSLKNETIILKDSILVTTNKLEACEERCLANECEIEYLRGVITDNNKKSPIIIYKEKTKD